jgi:hypothetical protein
MSTTKEEKLEEKLEEEEEEKEKAYAMFPAVSQPK